MDKKRIRTENTVIDNNEDDAGVLAKIVDYARMRFSSARNRRSARTGRRPRKLERRSSMYPPTSADVAERSLRATCGCAFLPCNIAVLRQQWRDL